MLGDSPVSPREEVAWRKGEEAAARARRWIVPDLHCLSKVSVRGGRGGKARAQTPQDSPPDFGGSCVARGGARGLSPRRGVLLWSAEEGIGEKKPCLRGKVAQAPLSGPGEEILETRGQILKKSRLPLLTLLRRPLRAFCWLSQRIQPFPSMGLGSGGALPTIQPGDCFFFF
ncbi:hypothetical protein L345_12503, partial [Ophiophagus hannah]